jgi:hypothetical protein
MSEWTVKPQLEENIRKAFAAPGIRPEFVENLYDQLLRAAEKKGKPRSMERKLPLAWVMTAAVLSLMISSTLIIGPQKVYASMLKMFDYVPGFGIVLQEDSLRILAAPVQTQQDGVTVSVNQVIITQNETDLKYGVSGVPLSAYPQGEQTVGCSEREYFQLPDGSRLGLSDPIPEHINSVTFVIPCIANTLPGTAPTNWELELQFIPAPPDFKVLPVVDVPPAATATASATSTQAVQTESAPTQVTPTAAPASVDLNVTQVIETEDGYILLGNVRSRLDLGSFLQVSGAIFIRDANGNKVSYTYPQDIQGSTEPSTSLGVSLPWAIQISGAGVTFPITIGLSGEIITQVDPKASARLEVDLGQNPQAGDVIAANQDVLIAGHTIRLLTITVASLEEYSFSIDPGADLSHVSVAIDGYPASGAGGGGNYRSGIFNTSLAFVELPKGKVTLVFSNALAAGPSQSWQTTWQPEHARDFSANEKAGSLCWTAATVPNIPDLPQAFGGRILITQASQDLAIIMANLDGSNQQVIAQGSARGALSPDGSKVAYSANEGIVIKDLASGTSSTIAGTFGRDLLWSPDGSRLANVNVGGQFGIFVMDLDGGNLKQLTNLGYESLAGWSADGQRLYYAIPGAAEQGFMLRAVDLTSTAGQDLFTLENSSRKAPMAQVSADGQWVAYRGVDNSSLYLKAMDGSPARLLMEQPALAITGLSWDPKGHWLAAGLMLEGTSEIILLAPDNCATYRLPGLWGEVDALRVP